MVPFITRNHEPFTNKNMVSVSRLITSQDKRLNVEQIKKHPFFYGVDWNSIRDIDAPFVPNLRSMTDTSYFPTDELAAVPDQPVGADTSGAQKDLAFLGYVALLIAQTVSYSFCPLRSLRYTFKRFTINP